MDEVKLSVCMVTYNHERYIAQAVESVLAQRATFPFEIVIGDDCSTDATPAILRQLAERHPDTIRLRLAKANQGAKANFLATISDCRGKYVAMLEGDDYWTDENKLQRQADALDAHSDWAICFHPTACVYESGLQGQATYPLDWSKPVTTIEDLLVANFIPTSSVVFRNRLFPAFPSWFRELKLGDWPLHILNAAHGHIGFLPEIMSAYRIHRGGIWNSETPFGRTTAIFQMFTALDHHFGGKHSAAIDRYRLSAVHEFVSELDRLKHKVANIADRLNPVKTDTSPRDNCVDLDLITIQDTYDQRLRELAALEQRNAALVSRYEKAKTLLDRWESSIPYRIYRETRRPFKQFLEFVRSRKSDGRRSQSTSTQKAA